MALKICYDDKVKNCKGKMECVSEQGLQSVSRIFFVPLRHRSWQQQSNSCLGAIYSVQKRRGNTGKGANKVRERTAIEMLEKRRDSRGPKQLTYLIVSVCVYRLFFPEVKSQKTQNFNYFFMPLVPKTRTGILLGVLTMKAPIELGLCEPKRQR